MSYERSENGQHLAARSPILIESFKKIPKNY